MKNIVVVCSLLLLLVGCSVDTTEAENKVVAVIGNTEIGTYIYNESDFTEEIELVEEIIRSAKVKDIEFKQSDVTLTCITNSGDKRVYDINYDEGLLKYEGKIYKLNSDRWEELRDMFLR